MLQHNSLSLLLFTLTTLLCWSVGSNAAPVHPLDFFLPTPGVNLRPRVEAGDFFLRVMPLGASITAGQGSKDNNGYRKFLRDALRADGWNGGYTPVSNDEWIIMTNNAHGKQHASRDSSSTTHSFALTRDLKWLYTTERRSRVATLP